MNKNREICRVCGNPIYSILDGTLMGGNVDCSQICFGFHMTSTWEYSAVQDTPIDATNYVRLSPLDMDKIRTMIAEEIDKALVARGSKVEKDGKA